MSTKIPQGEKDYQLSHPHEVSTNGLTVFRIVALVIVEIAVALRMFGRKKQRIPLRSDDYTLLVSAVLIIGYCVCGVLSVKYGYGHHSLVISKDTFPQRAKAGFVGGILYTTCFPISRISLVLLYRRVFVRKWFQYVCWFMIFAYSCYSISTVFIDIFGILPVRAYWNKSVKVEHKIDSTKLTRANTLFNIISDIILLVLPLTIIWTLRMRKLAKLGLSLIFCLGALTLIASVMRYYYSFHTNKYDPDFSGANGSWWTNAELYLGILCPCLVTFQPVVIVLYRACLPYLSPGTRDTISRFTGVNPSDTRLGDEKEIIGRTESGSTQINNTSSLKSKPSDIEAQTSVIHDGEKQVSTVQNNAVGNTGMHRDEKGMAVDQDAVLVGLDPRLQIKTLQDGTKSQPMGSSVQVGVDDGKRGNLPDRAIGVKNEWQLERSKDEK